MILYFHRLARSTDTLIGKCVISFLFTDTLYIYVDFTRIDFYFLSDIASWKSSLSPTKIYLFIYFGI